MTLAEFLAARLDEDEAGASGCMNCGQPIRPAVTKTGYTHGDRSAVGGGWQGVRCPGKVTGALPWPDPARVLREVAAKRAILELLAAAEEYDDKSVGVATLRMVAKRFAGVYSDHPAYAEVQPPAV